jgi:hypothetical protein
MKKATRITRIFLDIGGVLLTDGWDHLARRRTAKNFKLEWAEMASCFQARRPAASRSFRACSIIPRLAISVAK